MAVRACQSFVVFTHLPPQKILAKNSNFNCDFIMCQIFVNLTEMDSSWRVLSKSVIFKLKKSITKFVFKRFYFFVFAVQRSTQPIRKKRKSRISVENFLRLIFSIQILQILIDLVKSYPFLLDLSIFDI